ncbi:hypothetical protein BP5796_07915 [Coleophoma crateriformis]|uniref:YDG domain-containing protein n=1 Tax=Coleophoma crateriformis TaxID=565419 RepID=A0A3D8RDB1_9HELO|nr:hypothetical protein BP5796_07915 [Coleophoma crateriformis]
MNNPAPALNLTQPSPPRPDHPVFGDNGPMRGFLWDGPGKYYRDPAKGHLWREPKVFGHNGCQVGQVWCTQFAAWRDGAHGSSGSKSSISSIEVFPYESGMEFGNFRSRGLKFRDWEPASIRSHNKAITFDEDEGVYSIIVKSKENYDNNDEIYYLPLSDGGPSSDANMTAPACQAFARSAMENEMCKREAAAGRVSTSQRKFVRVLRAHGGEVALSPKEGLRYDGLYTVESIGKVARDDGPNSICLVRLVREHFQPPVDLTRPTPAEREVFRQIRAGY